MFLRTTRRLPAVFLAALAVCAASPHREAAAADPGSAVRGAPVGMGDQAPDFTLPDQDGRAHTLSKERAAQDAVVLIFYRGHW